MKKQKKNIEATMYADFETTVSEDTFNQTLTEVWSAAYAYKGEPNDPSSVHVLHSIDEFMVYLDNLIYDVKVYFHNLKFDGSFILTYLLKHKYTPIDHNIQPQHKHEFNYMISSKGIWYSIVFQNAKRHTVTIWDSLKLAPMSLKQLGKSFKTKHQKLEMNYVGSNHYPNCPITDEELAYIKNDVLVLKEVMEILSDQSIDAMTIGQACLQEYKKGYSFFEYKDLFPDLTKYTLPDINMGEERYSHDRTVDDFIRRSYHGGFCYVNPKYQNKVLTYTSHLDANSHYPSMMHSRSGNYYPVGEPYYISFESQFNEFKQLPYDQCFYFVRFQCVFDLKSNHIPSVQIKGDRRFNQNEWLVSSNYQAVDMVMSRPDFEHFVEIYDLHDFLFIEAVIFHTKIGLFDKYIDHWMKIKQVSTGAQRQIAKLFLNNLYGKFAASTLSSYKVAVYKPKEGLKYTSVTENAKKAGYIAIGSAITAYARVKTMSIAEENIDSYVYSDTDSNVFTIPEQDIKSVYIHPFELTGWKVESESDQSYFVRQKTYYEHVVSVDGQSILEPYDNFKCCGMDETAKQNFLVGLHDGTFKLTDLKSGFEINGNLRSKNIDGGILLVDSPYRMR